MYAGMVFLVADVQENLWPPSELQPKNWWFSFFRMFHGIGWCFAFVLANLRVALVSLKLYDIVRSPGATPRLALGSNMETEDMLKILGFFLHFWLFCPFYTVVSLVCKK